MKKIAFALKRYLNLTETFIYAQLKSLSSFEAVVLADEVRNLEKFPHPKVFSISDLPPLGQLIEKITDPFGGFKYFKKVIKEEGVSLIHAHFGWEGIFMLPLKRRLGLPLVTSFYGIDVYKMTRNPIYAAQQRKLFKEGDLFIACSEQMRKDLVGMGCPEEKSRTYYLGVDLSKLKYKRRSVNAGEPLQVLMCGRFIEKKGFIYGLRAFHQVLGEHGSIKLKIIGSGPKEEEIKEYIKKHSLENSVSLLGNRTYNEYIDELYRSHVMMSPSITAGSGDQEGLPMVLIEAQATGMPVIATNYAGIPELIDDGVNGYLAREKSIDDLAGALNKMLDHPELVEKFGGAGRSRVEERFDLLKQVRKLESKYKELIG